jgi:hypothetical protein
MTALGSTCLTAGGGTMDGGEAAGGKIDGCPGCTVPGGLAGRCSGGSSGRGGAKRKGVPTAGRSCCAQPACGMMDAPTIRPAIKARTGTLTAEAIIGDNLFDRSQGRRYVPSGQEHTAADQNRKKGQQNDPGNAFHVHSRPNNVPGAAVAPGPQLDDSQLSLC